MVNTKVKPYKCNDCNGRYKSQGELLRHVRYKHTHEKPFKCTECSYAAVERSKLACHMISHTGSPSFQCPHGKYLCVDHFKLKNHLRTHTTGNPYHCEICQTSFTQVNSLKYHLKQTHSKTGDKYECHICHTLYTCKSDLRSHIQKQHTNGSLLRCLKCNKCFMDRISLKNHSKSHEKKDKYECDVCSFTASSKNYIKQHRKWHERSFFKCSVCNDRFTTKKLLAKHENLHPNFCKFPKYECNDCGDKYVSKQYLIHHIKTYHKHYNTKMLKLSKFQKELSDYSPDLLTITKNLKEGDVIVLPDKNGEKYIMFEILTNESSSQPITLTSSNSFANNKILKEFYIEVEDDRMKIKIEPESDVEISDEEVEPFYGFDLNHS